MVAVVLREAFIQKSPFPPLLLTRISFYSIFCFVCVHAAIFILWATRKGDRHKIPRGRAVLLQWSRSGLPLALVTTYSHKDGERPKRARSELLEDKEDPLTVSKMK